MSRLSPRRVVHVQLDDPLAELPAGEDGRGVYAVFWVGDSPVGHGYFDADELPLPSAELGTRAAAAVAPAVAGRLAPSVAGYKGLAALARPLRTLETVRAAAPEPGPSVSVVVLAGEGPRGLDRCLTSLEHMSARPQAVIVVDTGTDPAGTLAVARSFGHAVLKADEPLDTHGDVIAFTEDRCTVHPRWLDAVTAPFRDARVGAVAGLVLAAELETEVQAAFERVLGGLNLGFVPLRYAPSSPRSTRLGASANLAVRATWFRELDPDTGMRLGRDALDRLAAAGAWQRLHAAGLEGRYEPDAVVYRRHPRGQAEAVRAARSPASAPMSSGRLLDRAAQGLLFGNALQRRLLGAQLVGRIAASSYAGSMSRAVASLRAHAAGEQ